MFVGNKVNDHTAGHAIYATSFHPCQVIDTSNTTYKVITNISEVFTRRGIKFDPSRTGHPQIATSGALFHKHGHTPLMIIPGEKYQHNVTMADELGQSVKV